MPPKRMSDILHSSSIDSRISASSPAPTNTAATAQGKATAPHSSESEGPTLPIITAAAASNENSNGAQNGRKRKRGVGEAKGVRKAGRRKGGEDAEEERRTGTNHPALYTPWELLPAKERKALDSLGSEDERGNVGEENKKKEGGNAKVQVLVWSRNQNVKAGIKRLSNVLGSDTAGEETGDGGEGRREAGRERDEAEKIIAVSAQGEGTVKLVGIVDMVRRIVADERNKTQGEGKGEAEARKWFIYTVLSSVRVPRRKPSLLPGGREKATQEQQGEEAAEEVERGDAMEIDNQSGVEDGAVKNTQEEEAGKQEEKERGATKIAPVLTVWFSQQRIKGWREAFGEQELVVSTSA